MLIGKRSAEALRQVLDDRVLFCFFLLSEHLLLTVEEALSVKFGAAATAATPCTATGRLGVAPRCLGRLL